jgi:hypothetical protein
MDPILVAAYAYLYAWSAFFRYITMYVKIPIATILTTSAVPGNKSATNMANAAARSVPNRRSDAL